MIKSIPNFGAIAPGTTHLASTLQYTYSGNLFSVAGEVTSTTGTEYPIDENLTLADGCWFIQLGRMNNNPPEVRAIAVGDPPPEGWQAIQMLAGFGSGVMVVGGEIIADVYVLTVVDNPAPPD